MGALSRNWLWVIGIAVLFAGIYYFSDIVTYILIAWVISMLGRPIFVFYLRYLRWGKLRIGPSAASLLTILTFFLLASGVVFMFVPTIVAQARHLASVDYHALGEKLKIPFANLDLRLHELGLLQPGESLGTRVQQSLQGWFRPALVGDFVGAFLATAGNAVVLISSVSFILFFFLKENRLFTDIIHAVVPNELEAKVQHAVRDSSDMLTRYFGGLVTQVLAFATVVTVVLLISGVPNALLIGAFGGIFNVIPYVGPILGAIFGLFITLSSHIEVEFALLGPMLLKVVIAFVVAQLLDNSFLGPLIFSNSVKAHPLEIFIVTIMAAKLGGVVGMVLGIPVYTVLRVIARVFFSEFKLVQRLTDHLEEEETKDPRAEL
jgi:predicted PurR-regulated permease PerM